MLKIKDGIDLKELEKFGFETTIGSSWYFKDIVDCAEEKVSIAIRKNDRRIQISYDTKQSIRLCSFIERELDILFDLIQAGLVEKVSD